MGGDHSALATSDVGLPSTVVGHVLDQMMEMGCSRPPCFDLAHQGQSLMILKLRANVELKHLTM